jgi:SAM-dependent methyltransferase
MPVGQEVHRIEVEKWDGIAARARSDLSLRLHDGDFSAYCARVATMAGIAPFLGPLDGREVLELGCGLGEITTLLALSGARVTATDLSSRSIAVARRRARLHDVAGCVDFVVAPGEELPFPDERFDVVVGKAILHHLDVRRAAPELHRVLRRGGRAAFSEPLGMNPVLTFAREHLPYPGKNPRGADRPLDQADVAAWGAPFGDARHREIQLLAMAERALGHRRLPLLRRLDRHLLERAPGLRRYCRYVVITLRK